MQRLGLDPVEMLIVPRVLALVLVLPLLGSLQHRGPGRRRLRRGDRARHLAVDVYRPPCRARSAVDLLDRRHQSARFRLPDRRHRLLRGLQGQRQRQNRWANAPRSRWWRGFSS